MDYYITQHMMNLYGMGPNSLPALHFPRIPPGLTHPLSPIRPEFKKQFTNHGTSLNPKLEDFRQMYHNMALGLLQMNNPGIVPPGHPLHSRENSIETLQTENSKLQKENQELKKQLEKVNQSKSNH